MVDLTFISFHIKDKLRIESLQNIEYLFWIENLIDWIIRIKIWIYCNIFFFRI